jgi:hypothetical protein
MLSGMSGLPAWGGSGPSREDEAAAPASADDLAQIKRQLAELQQKLSKL